VLLTTYPLISSHKHNGDDTFQSYSLPSPENMELMRQTLIKA